jgi:deoxyribonuclease IV
LVRRVKVSHCDDAKAERGSKLDRHQRNRKGTIGRETFAVCSTIFGWRNGALIAETSNQQAGEDRRKRGRAVETGFGLIGNASTATIAS